MTEAEWLICTKTYPMLEFLQDKMSDRRLRLFACACCRRIWHLLRDERSRNGVELAERFADGEASGDELKAASTAAWAVAMDHSLRRSEYVADAAAKATWGDDKFGGSYHASLLTYDIFYALGEAESEWIAQCRLLREITGNPFHSVAVNPSWLTWNDGTVAKLAQTIYDKRAFDRLPSLADALEVAGCTDADILNHCRQPGEHVRGCWALDLVLGKV